MTIETPTNCWTETEQLIADELPKLAAFRSFCEVSTEAEAAAKVFYGEGDAPANGEAFTLVEMQALGAAARIFSTHERGPYRLVRRNGRAAFGGRVVVILEKLTPAAHLANELADNGWRERWFKNRVGDTMNQLFANCLASGAPKIRSIEVTSGPHRNPPEKWPTQGAWHWAELVIVWGENDD